MTDRVGLVLVSHVPAIAEGTATLVAQMAPDVTVRSAGGTDEGGIGTSFDLVLGAVEDAERGAGAVVLYDLGSALLTTESALELLDEDRRDRVRVADAPLVEGALAAAVAAQAGADLVAVVAAAESAGAPPLASAGGQQEEAAGSEHRVVTLVNPLGLHARPAAQLATALAGLDARVRLARPGGAPVDARSLLAVVALAVRGGDEVDVTAAGTEASRALELVSALVADGFGETDERPDAAASAPETGPTGAADSPKGTAAYVGIPVSPGTAVGVIRRLAAADVALPPEDRAGDPAEERRRLLEAIERVRVRVAGEAGRLAEAHALLVTDPALRDPALASVGGGATAEAAWWRAVQGGRDVLSAGGDEIVAGRAVDVLDVGLQVLAELDPALAAGALPPPETLHGSIAVAEDLLPSQVPVLARAGVSGVVTAAGGRTAHASLLARGLGLPMVVAAGPGILALPEDAPAVLDANAGCLTAPAAPQELEDARQRVAAETQARDAERAAAYAPVVLHDGRTVGVAANVASPEEARAAAENGADGIGLLRTELLFLDRRTLPSEEEQAARLGEVLAALPGRPVVVRTLDVGGDKRLPALHLDPVRNGFLGERGLRHGLAHPEVLRTQVRAVLRAAAQHDGEVALMAPMVTFPDEVAAFRDIVQTAGRELADQGTAYRMPHALGIMVEVPAAALAAEEVAAGLDFVSVGTNDLVQYLTAAERTLPEVAALYRPDATAVWRALELIVTGAHAAGARVCVCGEMAGDPAFATRLVALGVDELSVAPDSVPTVKAALRLHDSR